ncbi:MAG: 50S ribosomal protein L1 [Thermoplasmata archaeon]|nr:50S ribosomal protein L1 [Thermoplasmata archaeon]
MDKNIYDTVKKALEESKKRNFKESVDLAFNLKYVDLSDPKKRINEEIILPHGRGKPIKVAVFASGETALKAKNSADLVITPEELDKLAEDKRKAKKLANEYDFFLAESSLMTKIGKLLGVVLGPRGKMPKAIPPGVDPTPIINNLKRTVRARSREKRTFHVPVGTRDMKPEDITENIEEVIKKITSKLDKGTGNIDSIYLKTTMGPSYKLEVK